MFVKKFTFNPVEVNTYLLWDETLECVIVDPGCSNPTEELKLKDFIESNKLQPVRLLNTHGHFDHVMGNEFVEHTWGLKSEIHQEDLFFIENASTSSARFGISMENPPLPGRYIEEGELISFGSTKLQVIFVPGHAPGHVAFYCEADKILIGGDILFRGSVGRTDLPRGNHEELIAGIKEKLMILDPQIIVYCGHGAETTIGAELQQNPFLR
jgi:glyoxylase-like metal-dependent hydrolase (beta-lactamase superfamily II)